MFKKIIIPLLLILFLASMAAFGAPNYVNIGPTTELDGDIKILSEIVAEGVTPDDWETTILFTDPTADRTITIPDADVTVGIVTGIVPPDHGGTGIANNAASTITITGAFATTLTVTGVTAITLPESGILVSDGTACTDIEGTGLSIAGGVLNWAAPVNSIDSDAYVDASIDHEHLHNDVIHGLTLASPLAAADEFMFWDETAGALRKIGWTAFMNSISGITNVSLVVGRDADNNISWAVDDTLTIEIAGVVSSIIDIETGAGDNDSLVTQGYVDDAVAGGGATAALDNLAAVQINTSLLSDAPDTDSLGTVDAEWLSVFIGDAGRLYLGLAQDISIHRSAAGIMTLTAANGVVTSAGLTVGGTLALGANNITLTGYIGRDADNFIDWTVDDSLTIEIGGVQHDIVSISDGAGDNDKLVTQGYVDDAVVGGGANVALSNLAAVAINTSLLPDAADSWDLGAAADAEWLTLYLGTYGTIYFGVGQTESIAETAVNALLITATDGVSFSDEIWTTNIIGRDVDNYIGWDVDNTLKIEINNVLSSIVSISTGVGDNDKLVTQGYVDDIVGGASLALDNLAAVQINTSLLSDAPDTDSLGTDAAEWLNLYIGDAGKIYIGLAQDLSIHRSAANVMTLTASSGVVTSAGLTVTGALLPAAAESYALGSSDAEWTELFLDDSAYIYFGVGQDVHLFRSAANSLVVTASAGITFTGDIILGANSIGRDADNDIDFETDNQITFRVSGVDGMQILDSGELDMNANSVGFTLQTATGDGTTTIDWRLGLKFQFTHGAMGETFTFTAPTNPCGLTLKIIQDGVGARDCTWPGTVTWLGDEPTWTDGGASKTIIVAMFWDGTTYWAQGTPWET